MGSRYAEPSARTASASPRRARTVPLLLVLLLVTLAAGCGRDETDRVAPGGTDVAAAIAAPAGGTTTVRGYVVGQPTAPGVVVTDDFPSDFALALADAPGETDPAGMLFVQVPSGLRAEWGLAGNPGMLGERIEVTGRLARYFAHPGLKGVTAVAAAGPPTDDATGTGEGAGEGAEEGGEPGGSPSPGSPYDETYYASALGLTGSALKEELHAIVRGHTRLRYDEVWDALRDTDEDPRDPGNVLLLYSGRSQDKRLNGGGVDDWNREHVWARSRGGFGTGAGPGTDLHHLRPTDVTVNAARGSLDFDEGGSPLPEAPANRLDGDSFEPRGAVKGDVARMLFYMAVRYEGGDGWADLEPSDRVGSGGAPRIGRLSVLLAWNAEDPPSAFEMRRNDRIHQVWQGNRNPFIDHPEWADAIWQ